MNQLLDLDQRGVSELMTLVREGTSFGRLEANHTPDGVCNNMRIMWLFLEGGTVVKEGTPARFLRRGLVTREPLT